MKNYLRLINFILLFKITILEIALIVASSLSLFYLLKVEFNELENNLGDVLYFIITLLSLTRSVFSLFAFGILIFKLIYFKLSHYSTILYSLISLIIATTISLIIIEFIVGDIKYDINNKNTQNNYKIIDMYNCLKLIILILLLITSVVYIISSYFCYKFVQFIQKEIEFSPLYNLSNNSLSFDLYKNIINQSKEPNNKELKNEYNRLSYK